MAFVWRNFKFFDAELVRNPLCRIDISCCCCSEGLVFAGDGEGLISAVDRSSNNEGVKYEFSAYKGPVHYMKYMPSRNVLVTIGEEEQDPCIIRVWKLEEATTTGKISSQPFNEHRLFSSKRQPPSERIPLCPIYNRGAAISSKANGERDTVDNTLAPGVCTVVVAFDVASDLECTAVALVSGDIVLLVGDIERRKAVRMQWLRSSVGKGPIVFVGFTAAVYAPQVTGKKNKGQHLFTLGAPRRTEDGVMRVMYTAFTDCVTVWQVGSTDCEEHSCDPFGGAARGCCCITEGGQLIVASSTSDQIATFGKGEALSPRQRTPERFDSSNFSTAHVVEVAGHKRLLLSYRGYTVVLAQGDAWSDRFTLQCFDLPNKLRCLSRSQENYCTHVTWMLADASDILIFCREPVRHVETVSQSSGGSYGNQGSRFSGHASYQIVRLVEVGLERRLEQLFQKECYEIAQNIACRSHSEAVGSRRNNQQLIDIKRHYGDYLVGKRDYTGAMKQYVDIIGHVEPSYVIRVFVDAQQIVPLTRYLEELHNTRHHCPAQQSHTTLLLCCYIQLHDQAKLNEFIRRNDIHFDPRTAIDVCIEARHYEAALFLADKYAKPNDYITLQLNYLNNPREALEFIRSLCLDDAEAILLQYQGKRLIEALPRRTTDTLIDLCVRWSGPARRLAGDEAATSQGQSPKHPNRGDAKEFLHILSDFPVYLLHFLRGVVESGVMDDTDPKKETVIYNTLLELYITRELKHTLHSYVTPDEGESLPVESYEVRRQQALAFIAMYGGRYDPYHALLLTQQHYFEEGTLLLLRRLHCSTELMQYHARGLEAGVPSLIRQSTKDRLIDICLNSTNAGEGESTSNAETNPVSGGNTRELWLSLLSMLAHNPEDDGKDIGKVLDHIAALDALSPLPVLTTLSSSNPQLKLHTFRDYMVGMIQREMKRSHAIKTRTEARLNELHELHGKLEALQTRATTLQAFNCNHCGAPIDLPAVYFNCEHAFHQRCLSDAAKCNLCFPTNDTFAKVGQQQRADENERRDFFQRLNGVSYEKGFDVVVEQFGGGITNVQRLHKPDLLCNSSSMNLGLLNSSMNTSGAANGNRCPSESVMCDEDGTFDECGELLKPEDVELW